MEDNQTPGQRMYQEPATTGSLESLDDSSPISAFASLPQNAYQVDNTLEVHDQSRGGEEVSTPVTVRHAVTSFSKRKALIISVGITVLVTLFTGASTLILGRNAPKLPDGQSSLTVPVQDIGLTDERSAELPSELEGSPESLLVTGDVITRGNLKFSNNSFVTVLTSSELSANQTFTLPDASGTLCLDSNNCNYADLGQLGQLNAQVAQLGQQLNNFTITANSGVTSVNNQTGTVSIQGSLNQITVSTAGGVLTLSTPQNLDANANVQFGNLTLGAGGSIRANNIQQTVAGNDVAINAGADSIVFTAGGRTFTLPTSGPGTQTICTDGVSCASGGGQAVILSPTSVQNDTSADASIFINDTGGGNLIQVQSLGINRLVVDNVGNTTVAGSLTVSSLGNGFVRSTGGLLSVVSAIDLASSDVTNTLPVNRGGTGAASLTANGVLVGNGTSPVGSVAAGGSGLCLVSTAGAPTFTTCPGVSSLNSLTGSITLQGTANQVSVSTGAGVITLSTPQDINTTSSPTFAALTLSGLTNGVVRVSAGTLTTGLVSLSSEVSGTLPVANGGTGLAAVPTNGQLLIGNGTNYTLASLTQGAGIAIANGSGTITIASTFGAEIDLGTETAGDYVSGVSGGTGVNVTGSGGEGSTPSIALILQANKGLEVDGNGLSLIDCAVDQILKYNVSNQWVCAADVDTTGSFNIAGDSGTPETVANGDTVTIQGGNNITTSVGATDTITVATVNNPTFTTSVTTPLLQSSGALSITPNGALTVGATGQTALLQGSTTTITSNGASNDIVLTSADQIRFTGFNCTAFGNGGKLTTDASGNISCAADNSADPNAITGTGTANRLAIFSGAQAIADSWLLQNGSTLELDNTRNLSLTGGNFSVTGTGLFTGLITANGGITVETGDTFTFNGEAFTDLTGTGLQFSSGSLQTTLGTSVDLTTEVVGVLPVTNGGTGVDGSAAANGTLLIGNGTGYTLATLTAGSGITVNNSAGGIEVVNFFGTSIESGEITDLTITGADIANDTIALGTKTTGNYIATIAGSAQIDVTGSGSETAAVTLALVADSIGNTHLEFDTGQNLTTTSSPSFNGLTLSGNLTVQGGGATIGTTTQAGTLTLSDGSSNTGALQTAGLGQDTTFTLPDPSQASVDICLSTGNCAGAGGGVTTAGGTANRIALFTGAQTVADSWLLQNGSTMQLDNTRNLELIGGNLTLTSGNLSVTGNQTTSGTVTFSALANGFLEVNGSGLVSVGTIDLGTDTSGNYVATITAGNGITGSSSTEGGTPTIALGPLSADWVQSGAFDIVLGDAGAELRILESVGATFYGTFDVGDLSGNEAYTFLQGGTVVTSGNVSSFATTAVTAGNGLTGGGTTGALTLDIGAGNGITVNANDIAVIYGSAANTAVQGNTSITVSAGTNLTGGGSITLGAGGTVTLDVANSPTFSGTVTVQGSSVSIGTASTTTGSLDLYNASSTFAGSVQVASLGQATLYTLPDPGAASASICLSTGNCAGAGGGVTTAGGTNNQLAKFTGAQTIADSTISDDGTNVTTSVDLIVQGGSATIGTALQDGALTLYGNGFTAVISAALTGNQTYTLPDGTGEFCIKELGNCSGAAGGNAPNSAQYLTLALDAGLTAERTLSFNGTNFSVVDGGANGSYTVNTAQNIDIAATPSFAGLTLTGNLNMNANTIQGTTAVIDFTNFDVASNGAVAAGTYNGQTISSSASLTGTLAVAGLTTLNGGLTIETGDTFTFNGDAFTDLTGNGLQVSTNVLTLMVQANKGLEVDGSGLSLIDCLDGEILKYNGSNQWACATDAGAGGVGDDVLVNGVNAAGANFINTAANGSTASVTWSLNNVTDPDEISLTVGVASATEAGIITTGAQTFAGLKTFNNGITLAANQTINLTGGTTASRPGSPTEGMLYYDTDTDKLLVYSGGKWQADRSTATKIVAANNSSQAAKDSADYVADGTADQVEINAALTAAAGGKVYLLEGTYVASASISVPNNTTLAGGGRGTLIELADLDASVNLIENTDQSTGIGIVIQDLRVDGRDDLNTAGTQRGIYLNSHQDRITNVWAENFRSTGMFLNDTYETVLTGNIAANNGGMGIQAEGSNITISNNVATTNGGDGFNLEVVSSTITNNTATGNGGDGFHLPASSIDNTLSSNTVTSNSQHGILLASCNLCVFTRGNIVSNNIIASNGGAGAFDGIHLTYADNNTITGNRITDTSGTGYAINIFDSTSDNNYISGNVYSGTGASSINDAGTGTIYGGQLTGTNDFALQGMNNVSIGTLTSDAKLEVLQSSTSTTAGTLKGYELTVTDTGVVTTGTDTTYGQRISVTRTGATGGTINTYGLDIQATGDTGGTSTLTGLNVNVSGADTNYAATFQGGNVGIGTATPASGRALHVVGGDNVIRVQSTSASAFIEFRNTGSGPNGAAISSTGDNFQIWTAGSARLTVSSAGDSSFSGNVSTTGTVTADSTGTFGAAHATLGVQMGGGTNGSEIKLRNSGTSHFSIANTANTLTIGAANGSAGIGAAITPFLTMDGSTGATTFASTLAVQGTSVTIGAAALQGSLILNDGDGETVSITIDDVAANSVLKIPDSISASDTFCFVNLNNCVGLGATSVGAIDGGTPDANGAQIAAGVLYLQSATATLPGLVTTGAQTFGGAKTFNSSVTVATDLTVDTNTLFVDATSNNIGLGTASPEFKLHVVSDGGTGAGYVSNDTYGSGAVFQGRSANGTLALPTALTTGNIIAQFSGRGYGNTGFSGTRAAIVMNAAENWTDLAQGSNINFFTTAIGTTTLAVQATLTGTGNFGLGTETPTAPFGGRVLEVQNTSGNASLYLNSGTNDAAMLILGDGAASWHIENDANDFFSLTQSGVAQRFAIDTSGNVGIGVYDASYRLDVESATATMRVRATDGDIAASTVYQNNLSSNFEVGINGGSHATNPNDAFLWQYSNNDIRLGTNNIERLLIEADGDVFVGNGSVNAAPNAGFLQGTGSGTAGTIGGVLTVAGGAGATATTGSAGGGLNLQGGNAGGSGNNNGGTVAISGGTSTGTTGLRGSVDLQSAGGNVNIGSNNNGAIVSWTTNGNALPATRADAGIVSHNGYVYVFGGSAGGVFDSPITTVHYAKVNANGSIGTWGTTSAMSAARQEFGYTVANGYVYAFGGNSASYLSPSLTNTVQFARIKADGTLDTWQTTTSLPGTRRLTSATSANGYVYVVGGTGGQTAVYYAKVNVDGTISSWTTSANSLPAGREAAGVAAVNGYLYVVGGADSGATAQTSVYYSKLDPTNGSNAAFTTETDTLPAARADAELVVMNGHLYLLGGQAGSAVSTTYYAQINNNGSINAWSTNSAAITAGRYGHMSVAVNGYAYVMGGINGGSGQSTVYYASTQRVRMAGAIDLLGISGENLAEGGIASSLAAGNTFISGSLQVTDTASIAGAVTIGRELNVGGSTYVRASSATSVGMTVQGASGQTADLMQLKDGSGTVVTKFMSDGTALFGSATNCAAVAILICIDESRIELKNSGGNLATQIVQNSNGPLEFSTGPNGGGSFAGVLVKGNNTDAFEIQNGSSQAIFTADTVNSQLLTTNINPLTAAASTSLVTTTPDSTGDTGYYPNVKMGSDGFARVAYHDRTNTNLMYMVCDNDDCSTNTKTTVNTGLGSDGEAVDMELGTDGFARIVHTNGAPNYHLYYTVCQNDDCSTSTTTNLTAIDSWAYLDVELNASNLARIAYKDYANADLRYIECTNADCSTRNDVLIDNGNIGDWVELELASDTFPRFAYSDDVAGNVKYARCVNVGCSSGTVVTTVINENDAYGVFGLKLDGDDNALLTYNSFVTGVKDNAVLVRCTTADCTSRERTIIATNAGYETTLALDSEGLPRITYTTNPSYDLIYTECKDMACRARTETQFLLAGDTADSKLIVGSDDITRVVATDWVNKDLKFIVPSYSTGLKIGTSSSRYDKVFVQNIEAATSIRIGDANNGIYFSSSTPYRLYGTARNDRAVTLRPEFEGITLNGTGVGTLTSGFCSNRTGGLIVNSGLCPTNTSHSYYKWSSSETTAQSYDMYIRYTLPSDFDGFAASDTLKLYGQRDLATDIVAYSLYEADGDQCGSTTTVTSANDTWQEVALTGDETQCNFAGGDVITIKITVTSEDSGSAYVGEMRFTYKSAF